MSDNATELLNVFYDEVKQLSQSVKDLFEKKLSKEISAIDFFDKMDNIFFQIRMLKSSSLALHLEEKNLFFYIEEILYAIKDDAIKFGEKISNFICFVLEKTSQRLDKDHLYFCIEECKKINNGELFDTKSIEKEFDSLGLFSDSKKVVSEKLNNEFEIKLSSNFFDMLSNSFYTLISKETEIKSKLKKLVKQSEYFGTIEYSNSQKALYSQMVEFEDMLFAIQKSVLDFKKIDFALAFENLSKIVSELEQKYSKKIYIENNNLQVFAEKEIVFGFEDIFFSVLDFIVSKNISSAANFLLYIIPELNSFSIKIKDENGIMDFDKIREIIIKHSPEEMILSKILLGLEKLSGKFSLEKDNEKTIFSITLPYSLSSIQGVFVKSSNENFLIPSSDILEVVYKKENEFIKSSNKNYIMYKDEKIPLYFLSYLLENTSFVKASNFYNIIITEYMEQKAGIVVDTIEKYVSHPMKPLPVEFENFSILQGFVFNENYHLVPVINLYKALMKFASMSSYEIKIHDAKNYKKTPNILCVDSSENTLEIEKSAVKNSGYDFVLAKDGIEALAMLKENVFDLIICGDKMPRMDGLTLLENLRRNDDYKNVPFIVNFVKFNEELWLEYKNSGAQAWCEKSNFDRTNLLNAVEEFLNEK